METAILAHPIAVGAVKRGFKNKNIDESIGIAELEFYGINSIEKAINFINNTEDKHGLDN